MKSSAPDLLDSGLPSGLSAPTGFLVDDDPALTSWELKKKDLNVFRFGRGGRGPIDALRKRIRSWAHKRRDWTPSPLLFLGETYPESSRPCATYVRPLRLHLIH